MTDTTTLAGLESRIVAADWFSRLGSFREQPGRRAIANLSAWDAAVFAPDTDPRLAAIAAEMDWLPASKDEPDPFHADVLASRLERSDSARVLDVCRAAMKSLRGATRRDALRSGPHDYAGAAERAALHCVRMAAIETVLGTPGPWNEVLALYLAGHWPCGILPGGDLVVY